MSEARKLGLITPHLQGEHMATRTKSAKPAGRARVVSRVVDDGRFFEHDEHDPFTPGLHVAPWLNGWGGIELVAIDKEGRLAGMLSVTAGYASCDVFLHQTGALATELEFYDAELFSSFRSWQKRLGHKLWEPGIHRCPWKTRTFSDGVGLLVIAPNYTLWGYNEAAELTSHFVEEVEETLRSAFKDGDGIMTYDYGAREDIERGEHGRLIRVEQEYRRDREEYGKLIGLGAAVRDPAEASAAD